MTESFAITRCAEMLKTVALCAQALTSNATGDDVVCVEGVTMTLLQKGVVKEVKKTEKSGVAEFALRIPSAEIRDFSVQADLDPGLQASFTFRLAADQTYVRGDNFESTRKAYVHQVRFFLDPKGWIAVRVSNEAGRILTGVRVWIRRPDKSLTRKDVTAADLRPDGSYRVDQLPPGSYEILLPQIDQDYWKACPPPPNPVVLSAWNAPADAPATGHPVVAGDCVWSLATKYGVPEDLIWKSASNKTLADKYKNGYTLLPGQTVQIPRRRLKTDPRALNACYDYVVRTPPREVVVRLVDWGKPAAAAIPGKVKMAGQADLDVVTDGEGAIRFPAPYGVTAATLEIPAFGLGLYTLSLGFLAPIESGDGVRERLENLGYYVEAGGGDDKRRAALAGAVKSFQQTQGIALVEPEPDGSVNQATMDALVETCGA